MRSAREMAKMERSQALSLSRRFKGTGAEDIAGSGRAGSGPILSCVARYDPRKSACGMTVAPRIPTAEDAIAVNFDHRMLKVMAAHQYTMHPVPFERAPQKAHSQGKFATNRARP